MAYFRMGLPLAALAFLGTMPQAQAAVPGSIQSDCVLDGLRSVHKRQVYLLQEMAYDRVGVNGIGPTTPGVDAPLGAAEKLVTRKIFDLSLHSEADGCAAKFKWKPEKRRAAVLVAYAALAKEQADTILIRWYSGDRIKYYLANKAAFAKDATFGDAVMAAARKMAPGGKEPPQTELKALAAYYLTTRELDKLRLQFPR